MAEWQRQYRVRKTTAKIMLMTKNGVTEILELKLNAAEKKLLKKSNSHVQKVIKAFDKMKLV